MNRAEEIRIMSLPKMQEKFREAMGEFQITDWIWCPRCKEEQIAAIHVDMCDEEIDNYIRLPLPIDPVNPERGLQGMLKGYNKLHWRNDVGATLTSHPIDPECGGIDFDADTPTLALLKALAHQWNVGVEG